MNDHNLDDLIIDNIEPKNSKTKSFLTIIALLIVVLIVAIILTKIILKDPNAQKIAFEENNTEMISPELTLQSATKPEPMPKPKKEELSTIMENKLNAPAKETIEVTKEVIKVPKQTEVKNSTKEDERLQKEKAEKAKLAQEKAAQKKAEEERVKLEKAEKERVEQEKTAQEKATREKATQEKVTQEKVTQEKAAQEKAAKVKPTVKPKPVSSQVYYIQVGSFTKTPSTQFLNIIKKSGFNYKITPKAANGTKKLLIGPYKNRASADTALASVKDRINKNAFVVKK